MTKKYSEFREGLRPKTRAESAPRAAALLDANIIAIAGMVLVFDEDESGAAQED